MGADNVDVFQRMVFSIPPLDIQLPALFVLSIVYSTGSYVAFDLFTPVDLELSTIVLAAVLVYLLPSLLAGELFHRALPEYPRTWSHFLALFNQFILFLYALILSGADTIANAWSVVWLLFITIYLVNILVLVVSTGIEQYKRILLVSLTQPAILIGVVSAFSGPAIEISTYRHAFGFASLLIAAGFLLFVLLAVDYLIKSNTDVSAFRLTSGLLQNNREALDLGVTAEPDVQTLSVDNGEELTLTAPWVHPGPLGGFGGGKLSGTIISALNDGGTGFFLHVPCTHKEDLANPEDAQKILDAVSDPDRTGSASRLVSQEYEEIEFYGRRIGDKKVVFMDAPEIDDYDTGVFMRDVDKDDVLLVDLHRHDIQNGPDTEIQYGSARADRLKRSFDDFRRQLDDLDRHDYRAGFDVRQTDQNIMAMVESVDDQDVLLMGIDTNGATADIRELADSYQSAFDEVLLFSTDTHASIHDLANMRRSNVDAMAELVESARESVATATIGLSNRKAPPLKLLKNDYNGLVFSVNILIRLTIIALLALYLFLVLWVF